MDPDLSEPRVSIWGMDNPTTQIAVSVFLDRFLRGSWNAVPPFPPSSFDMDEEGEDEADVEPDEPEDD